MSPELKTSLPANSARNEKDYASLPRKTSRDELSKERSIKIKFRTTGAGFRQRKHESQDEKPDKKIKIFKISPSKVNRERP